MTEAVKHTRGPWTSDGSHIYAPDGAIIAVVHNPGSTAADYPLVANGNLIAAGPEMLEALRGIEHFSDALNFRTDTLSVELRKWIDAGRAAIARAS